MALSHIKKFISRKPSVFFCSVRLTSLCSQACLQCGIPSQSDGSFITPESFRQITQKLYKYGTRVLTLTGGEPALHPQLEEIMQIARATGFRAIGLLTNLYYPEAHQDKVIALSQDYGIGIHTSYDGLGEVADTLRGARDVQATVERGMLKINEQRKQGLYQGQPTATVVVSALNIKQLPEIINRLEELKWSLNIDFYRWESSNHRENDILKIKEADQIRQALQQIRQTQGLKTPLWYYDGLESRLNGNKLKQCPYLISPTFGSKFFVRENGDIYTCMNRVLGNLLKDELEDLFAGDIWNSLKVDFDNCRGCWNNCFTVSSRALSYVHMGTIRQYLWHKRRKTI